MSMCSQCPFFPCCEFHKFSQACSLKASTITRSPRHTPGRVKYFPHLHLCTHLINSTFGLPQLVFFFFYHSCIFPPNLFFNCYSITVVPMFPPLPSSSHPTLPLPHCCPCPWVIHTCSSSSPFAFFPPVLFWSQVQSGAWNGYPSTNMEQTI